MNLNNKIMIYNRISIIVFLLLCAVSFLSSCVKEDIAETSVIRDSETLKAVTHAYIEEEVPEETRANLKFDETNKVMHFTWEKDDCLLLFNKSIALDGSQNLAYAEYSLKTIVDDNTALFSGGGFNLATGYEYFAFTPYEAVLNNGSRQDVTNLELSYEGQHQSENNNSDHLGAYDYQVAMSSLGDDGKLNFDFEHLSATLRIKMKITDDEAKSRGYKTLSLYTADNFDFKMTRTINLLQDVKSSSDYHPTFDAVTAKSGGSVKHVITLDLGEDGNGIVPDEDGILCMYLSIPCSSELYNNGSPRTIYAEVTPVDDTAPHYNISFLAKDYEGGTCYTIGRQAVKSGQATLQVYVERAWQRGYLSDNTASAKNANSRDVIGDPGSEDSFIYPTCLMIYPCVDGNPITPVSFTGITKDKWKEDGTRLQYREPIYLNLGVTPTSRVCAYVVASNGESLTVSDVNTGIDYGEDEVYQMTFTLPKSCDNTAWTNNQTMLKNLYSTPYVEDSHNGLSNDMTNLNLIACLYHVACKIDLNWESNDNMKLNTCSVKNLLRTGKLFLPTDNSPITTGGDSYSHTMNNMENIFGRNYFFAIQQKSGDVFPLTVTWSYDDSKSSSKSDKIQLHPSEGDGFTSWFKINRKW